MRQKQGKSMCISSIMAVVDGEDGSAVAMQTALSLGETFDAFTALMQVLPPLTTGIPMCRDVKEQQIIDTLQSDVLTMHKRQRERFHRLYENSVKHLISISKICTAES